MTPLYSSVRQYQAGDCEAVFVEGFKGAVKGMIGSDGSMMLSGISKLADGVACQARERGDLRGYTMATVVSILADLVSTRV